MAFAGYEVSRSNIFNASVRDSSFTWIDCEVYNLVSDYMNENKSGDVVSVWENETEDSPYLIASYFNDPMTGWHAE